MLCLAHLAGSGALLFAADEATSDETRETLSCLHCMVMDRLRAAGSRGCMHACDAHGMETERWRWSRVAQRS